MTVDFETKIKAVYHYSLKKSLRKTSALFSVSKSSLQRWLFSCRFQTKSSPASIFARYRKVNEMMLLTVQDALQKQPFLTLKNIQIILKRSHSILLSLETVRRIIKQLKITRKRAKPIVLKSKTYWNALQEKRRIFMETYKTIDMHTVISIDETAICSNLYPLYGYQAKGKRLHVPTRSMRTQKYSLIMALSTEKIETIQIHKASINSDLFFSFLKETILRLKDPSPRTFLMDNVAFHKTKKNQELIRSHGHHVLFTPPYSPDTNPIENAFSVLKKSVRCDYGKPFFLVMSCLKQFQIKSSQIQSMFLRSQKTQPFFIAPELYRWIPP